MLDYDEGRHIYSDQGKIIPSVTQILAPPNPFYTPGSADRGHRAHEACAAFIRDPQGFPTETYADAFALWCFRYRPKVLKVEEIVEGELDGLRYAGRMDLLVEIGRWSTLVDLKTGKKAKWHHAQVAAYAYAARPAKCLVLYLHDDLTFTEDWLTSKELVAGLRAFQKALSSYGGPA